MIRRTIHTGMFSLVALAMSASLSLAQGHTSKPFSGAKVHAGNVTHSTKDGKDVLTLSDDFTVPDTPDPHWQVVDSKGNTYLLQRLGVKSLGGLAKDRINMSITLPAFAPVAQPLRGRRAAWMIDRPCCTWSSSSSGRSASSSSICGIRTPREFPILTMRVFVATVTTV